jgi:2-polyprenyl-3-methyl-5-hydroxy-6-metoxy-1,4-benzoquinol methylase
MSEVERKVREFYNNSPFPDYELSRFKDKEQLRLEAKEFVQILDRSIPQKASVIDIGCGTGQLAAFLSLRRDCVWGIDFSPGSLSKAMSLKEKLQLQTLSLRNVNIMNPREIEAIGKRFDCVLCLGVLHHTPDARQAFKNIATLLDDGGLIAVGLYNTLGRIPLQVRKLLVRTVFKGREDIRQRFIKMQIQTLDDQERLRGWWNDQYNHPHETVHTIGEVLKWFKEEGIKYNETIPPLSENLETTGLWREERYPHLPLRLGRQLTYLWKTQREGGYWMAFGKRVNIKSGKTIGGRS